MEERNKTRLKTRSKEGAKRRQGLELRRCTNLAIKVHFFGLNLLSYRLVNICVWGVGGKSKKLRLVDVVDFKVCKLWVMCILEKMTIG